MQAVELFCNRKRSLFEAVEIRVFTEMIEAVPDDLNCFVDADSVEVIGIAQVVGFRADCAVCQQIIPVIDYGCVLVNNETAIFGALIGVIITIISIRLLQRIRIVE